MIHAVIVIGMEIKTIFLKDIDGVDPVAILLGINVSLLQHKVLHLLQLVGIYLLGHALDTLVKQTNSQLRLVRIHRTVSLQHGLGLLRTC